VKNDKINFKKETAIMKNLLALKAHLSNNAGDENVSKMIWIVIVFVVGAILLTLITTAFSGKISDWYRGLINSWFNTTNGAYSAATL
jgi:hypothetical protein